MSYRCIQCGFPVKTLYVQYSPGNIRLMKCENCGTVADEYIECEIMILMIDLVLHKSKAFRHLLHNVINQGTIKFRGLLWKLAVIFLFLMLVAMDVFFGNFIFLLTSFHRFKIFFHASISASRWNDLLLVLMISGYFKIFFIAVMVWEFPSSMIFIIELFCLSSNIVALKVMTESTMIRCVLTCFSAYAIKFLVTRIL